MSDKLFVLPYKCTLNFAAKTHILLSRPDSLPTCYSHNTQIRVLSVQRLWETCNFGLVHLRVSLSGSLQPCGFHWLWEQQGRNCAFALARPYVWRMWTAGAGCRCCATGPWVIFSECLSTSDLWGRECSRWGGGLWVQRRGRPEWVIPPCVNTFEDFCQLQPRPAPCICPHLSVHFWVSGSYLSCQTLSQNNRTVFAHGKCPVTNTHLTHIGHFTTLNRCGHRSQTHALTVPLHRHFKDCYTKAPLQQSKHMQQSLHAQTQRKETYNQPLRKGSIVNHKREDP